MAMSSVVNTDRSALHLMSTLTSLDGTTKAAPVAGWSGSLLPSVKNMGFVFHALRRGGIDL